MRAEPVPCCWREQIGRSLSLLWLLVSRAVGLFPRYSAVCKAEENAAKDGTKKKVENPMAEMEIEPED